ncbi:MAG: tRNA (adenosine(37)-N6)-threonylcarbamoyltransferase complex transferase subunit TsaD [Candidatus Kerfeldbacteria bacterium]|nr:tRNA (adenosine(37)-N6)-threonylcarbamoyltransferase complex transferase subunit TsaD [Candidatus Kerfeldbacteria bacterium]
MLILGLETSCDETSVAILNLNRRQLRLAGFTVASQTTLHAPWGGVVPELAARRHTEVIVPLIDGTLKQAGTKPAQLDLITVTAGPGLITSLQVGVETAKALAAAWHKPLLGVNHIAGHLVSPFLSSGQWLTAKNKNTWPAIALVVSGGHTELYLMPSLAQWKLLGKTLDDAAGEAFDKVAKMLNLPYPGGPEVAKLAKEGNPLAFALPRPMINRRDYNFSFAGLKTAVLYTLKKENQGTRSEATLRVITRRVKLVANICASFQQAAIDVLVGKTIKAAREYRARSIIVSGGVSANQELRQQMRQRMNESLPGARLFLPELKFTGDNAAMIALAGAIQTTARGRKLKDNWATLQAKANWELW